MEENSMFRREVELGNDILLVDQLPEGDTGVVVWDAALVLTKYLDRTRNLVSGLNGVELGSGTGVVGLAAAVLGCNVTITDLEENLHLLKHNIDLNEALLQGNISAAVLKWGNTQDIKAVVEKQKADVILVADCVYYKESLEDLVNTMVQLCHSSSQVILSYEDRYSEVKIAVMKEFFRLMEVNFSWVEVPEDQHHPDFSSSDIHIIKFRPKLQS